jgi:hydroxymethylpyrimidine/phosphomethylpyrimidine kinase
LDDDQGRENVLQEAVKPPLEGTEERPILLTIAGFDPSSGAGASADLKVFAAHDAYGMACLTALTVQSTRGVRAVEPVAAATLAATLEMLAEDVTFAGIKLGMLANAEIVEVVNKFLIVENGVPVVLDPVLRSSSGRELLDLEGVQMLRARLLRRVDWITPNLVELAELTSLQVAGAGDVPLAAAELRRLAREAGNDRLNIVVTGGHLDPPDDYLLVADGSSCWIPGRRVETKATHGTGCAFSSALLCRAVAGDLPVVAVRRAKDYVASAMLAAYPVGGGHGPMNHLFTLETPLTKSQEDPVAQKPMML